MNEPNPVPTAPTAPPAAAPQSDATVGGRPLATPGRKFLAWLLDTVLFTVTLGIGWLVWAAKTASEGQTPARRILGLRILRLDTEQPATFGTMFLMRGIVGGIVQVVAFTVTLYVLAFMPLWDRRNQTVCDKVSGTVVVEDPS